MTAVLILAWILAQQVAPVEKCSLSGTVVDSVTGLPLGKVMVVAEHLTGNDPGASTTTDAKGGFVLVDVDAGRYRLSARRNGYLDTYLGAKRASREGSILALTPGQKIDNLGIKLTPFGVIAGTVRDADGEPLAGAFVNVYRISRNMGETRLMPMQDRLATNDLGEYRIGDLPPGRYYIASFIARGDGPRTVDHSVKSGDPQEWPVTTFYPGTSDPASARPVEVTAGSRITGVDMAIIRSRVYRIGVHIDTPAGLRARVYLIHAAFMLGVAAQTDKPNANGDVEISGVPPGMYNLQVAASEPDEAEGSDFAVFAPTQLRLFCETSVPITVDRHDLEGLRVAVSACAVGEGRVILEGVEKATLGGTEVDFDHGRRNATLKPDGSFATSLSPGSTNIDLSRIVRERGLYVKSIRSGNQDVLRSGFTAGASEHIELQVVLAADGGRIEGLVSDADGKAVAGATVVLIPNDPALRSRVDFTPEAVTDQAGHFELKNAAPGEYKLFAWDDIEPGSWFDPDVLGTYEAKGVPATVKARDSQSVKLQVIP